jgi:hypothetical protein
MNEQERQAKLGASKRVVDGDLWNNDNRGVRVTYALSVMRELAHFAALAALEMKVKNELTEEHSKILFGEICSAIIGFATCISDENIAEKESLQVQAPSKEMQAALTDFVKRVRAAMVDGCKAEIAGTEGN